MSPRSRLVLVLLLLALCLSCRQGGPANDPAASPGRPVVFVGLDGADWQLLDQLMRAGRMPNLAGLVREGQAGVLTTIQPPLSPLVWTTMMTGVSPLEHGILDFTRFNPRTGVREPIPGTERRVPAVWNMASDEAKSVAVFGMWATYPAEPVRGLMVADRFLSFTSGAGGPPPSSVHPPDREGWAREVLKRTEAEVGLAALRTYLPDLSEDEFRAAAARPDPYAHPVSALRKVLVETRAYDELARTWIARERPDLAIVYFQGTDTIGHVFAPYAPPRQPSISPEDFDRYHRVPEVYFAEVDRLLGGYRKLAEERGAVLFLASDHGFLWGEGRPERLSSAAVATAGRWHRDAGIYLLWGPGIAAGSERPRGRVGQVCATLLGLLGLPPGKGLEGGPLPGAPAPQGEPIDYRAHYKPAQAALSSGSSGSSEDEIAKLRALGYVGAGERTQAPQGSGSTRTAASWNNEGLLHRQAGRTREAVTAFEQALALDPQYASALWNLSDLLRAESREPDRSDDLLVRALEAGLPDGADQAGARAVEEARAGRSDRAIRLLDRALAVQPTEPKLLLTRGRLRLEGQDCHAALADFEKAAKSAPDLALAHSSVGLARLCLGDPTGAKAAFQRSLEIDPNQPEIARALAGL